MRTNVVFRHPAPLIPVPDGNGILSIEGAVWFESRLRKIPGLIVDSALCQEDWGVVIFVLRNRQRFWIGLGLIPGEGWGAFVNYGVLSIFQRFTSSGQREYQNLVMDLHKVLSDDPEITNIMWYPDDQFKLETAGQTP